MPIIPIPFENYPAIREAIDVELTADDLPDAVIERITVAGTAEDWVEAADPDWATRTGRGQRALQRALIYYAASLLVRRVAIITTETMGNYRYARAAADPDALIDELRGLAESEVAVATGADTLAESTPVAIFTVAHGYRGR